MKIIMIECTAGELRANRTILDSLTEAFSGFTRSFAGIDLTSEQVANYFAEQEEEEDEETNQ